MDTLTVHEPLLVNTIGHAVGTVVFALFLYLVLRDPVGVRLRASRLSIAAAALALIWNAASLLAMGLLENAQPPELRLQSSQELAAPAQPQPSISREASETDTRVADLVVGLGTAALSLLPAILLHLSLGGRRRRFCQAGYVLSGVAIAIHWSEFVLDAPEFHQHALRFTTLSFGALTLVVAVSLLRSGEPGREQRMRRLLGTMALFLFALSFVHFGFGLEPRAWPMEALIHHAGIPLALFVLLQDFRFVLLDALLRVLVNLTAAGATILAGVWLLEAAGLDFGSVHSQFLRGALFVGASLALVAFAAYRDRLQQWLTSGVFGRRDLAQALAELRRHPDKPGDEEYLEWAMNRVGEYVDAEVRTADPGLTDCLHGGRLFGPVFSTNLPDCRALLDIHGAEVVVPVRLSPEDVRYYLLGRRPGGRPYLSEDLEAVARLAEQVAEHVSHYRDLELRRLVSLAELRALQSQIHPHFLFNALNTLYGVIPREAKGARQTVLNLADIFRYFLQSEKTDLPLEEEIRIVEAYLDVEKLRLGNRLHVFVEMDDAARHRRIPVLSIQPLVENAVKHGVARLPEGGEVRLEARVEGELLRVSVKDTGRGFPQNDHPSVGRGVGLENVERRLRLCYGEECRLEIESGPRGSTVGFRIPARVRSEVVV